MLPVICISLFLRSWILWQRCKLWFKPNLSYTKICSLCQLSNPSTQSFSLYFSVYKIMPIDFNFQISILILFHRSCLGGEINLKLPLQNKITRLRAEFVPQRTNNNRGERSLLTTGVNLWKALLIGEEATGLPSLRRRLMASPWGCSSSLTM